MWLDADGEGDGFEQAGGDEAGGAAVEVEQRVGGLAAVDVVLVAESDDRVGESCSLLGGVDLLVDGGERVPAPVGVVVFDRFAQALEVGADQLRERDEQREVERGRSMSPSQRWSRAGSERPARSADCLAGERRDVRAGELVLGGAALLSAAALGFAA